MTDKQHFIEACLSDDLQKFYRQYINQKKSRAQQFFIYGDTLIHRVWTPSKICAYSGEALDRENIDVAHSYWTPHTWRPVKKEYKKAHMKDDAYECQKIDCSCNDCMFLDRAESRCKKFNKQVSIQPNTSMPQNLDCFKHRLDK